MPASDKHDSPDVADEVAERMRPDESTEGGYSPGFAIDSKPDFLYDPLAPEPGTPYDPLAADPAQPASSADPTSDSTVGTGTSIALGCIAGSVFLIIIAILILFLVSVFAN